MFFQFNKDFKFEIKIIQQCLIIKQSYTLQDSKCKSLEILTLHPNKHLSCGVESCKLQLFIFPTTKQILFHNRTYKDQAAKLWLSSQY